jgi:hypothetical protein
VPLFCHLQVREESRGFPLRKACRFLSRQHVADTRSTLRCSYRRELGPDSTVENLVAVPGPELDGVDDTVVRYKTSSVLKPSPQSWRPASVNCGTGLWRGCQRARVTTFSVVAPLTTKRAVQPIPMDQSTLSVALPEIGYIMATRSPRNEKGLPKTSCKPLLLLVAGAGFEPATFGL